MNRQVPDQNGMESDVRQVSAQYVFLDVVGFTDGRTVEAQTAIVRELNDAVRSALRELHVPTNRTILIPTGDGMCISLLNPHEFDLHLRLAIEILKRVARHNHAEKEEKRRFQVRVGLNENTDNLIIDVNGRRNVAGAGISTAARVMDKADGSQILASSAVYQRLQPRERYWNAFVEYQTFVKHNRPLLVYQYVGSEDVIDKSTPRALKANTPNARLPDTVAYYICHAQRNLGILRRQQRDEEKRAAGTALWLSARKSVEHDALDVPDAGSRLEDHIQNCLLLKSIFLREIIEHSMWPQLKMYRSLFDDDPSETHAPLLPNKKALDRIQHDWPKLWHLLTSGTAGSHTPARRPRRGNHN